MVDIDDRWHRKGPEGPERTARYGTRKRWRVRYPQLFTELLLVGRGR